MEIAAFRSQVLEQPMYIVRSLHTVVEDFHKDSAEDVAGTNLQDISLVPAEHLAALAEILSSWPRRCDVALTFLELIRALAATA